jgi:hypothetical protein
MKPVSAFALLLVGCTPSPSSYTPIQLAVINSMHETSLRNRTFLYNMAEISNQPMDEVEEKYARLYEYKPISFGNPTPFTRRDSINEILPNLTQQNFFLETELKKRAADSRKNDADELVSGRSRTKGELRAQLAASLRSKLEGNRRQIQQSTKLAADQIIGQRLLHVCGQGTRIDSGYFVVYTKGSVKVPRQFIEVGF